MLNKTIHNYNTRNWNSPNHFEPVGIEVFLFLDNGEILKGYRKNPSESKDKHGTYYRSYDDQPISENILGWSYA